MRKIRKNILSKCKPGGKIFFSVERFDYTKGIKERLEAIRRTFQKYPQRIGKDVYVLVQITFALRVYGAS